MSYRHDGLQHFLKVQISLNMDFGFFKKGEKRKPFTEFFYFYLIIFR